jgi:hypothetical protein
LNQILPLNIHKKLPLHLLSLDISNENRFIICFSLKVSTAQFEDRISDANMHSHTPFEPTLAKYRSSKMIDDEAKSEYWLEKAKAFVDEQLKKSPNMNQAKNIIMVKEILNKIAKVSQV